LIVSGIFVSLLAFRCTTTWWNSVNPKFNTAKRTTDIIGSLSPRKSASCLEDAEKKDLAKIVHETKAQAQSPLSDAEMETDSSAFKTKPIADLFPKRRSCLQTLLDSQPGVLCASQSQVFTLLENIYHEFDVIANRRVFKVETIECYSSRLWITRSKKDHHVVMARFARDCLYKVPQVNQKSRGPQRFGCQIGLRLGRLNSGQ
jgi:hypothetical protein